MSSLPARRWRIVHSECSLGWGGQEHRVLAELTGFRRRGHEVILLAPLPSAIAGRALDAGVRVRAISDGRARFPVELVRTAWWLRREGVDVVNTHSSRDGWMVGLAARLAGVPLVIRTRHIEVEYPRRWLSRHAFGTLADEVMTTSGQIRTRLVDELGLSAERVTTIPTGIDLCRFSPAVEPAVLASGRDRPWVGMVSVLRSWKGHRTFLEAAARRVSSGGAGTFFIVGEGPARRSIERGIAEFGLGHRVMLVGHREDIPQVLKALEVLVLASTRHEGVPQIGLQALAVGTPVVGSDVGGIPEIIRPGETGRIFRAGDAAGLESALRAVFEESEATRRYVEQGRRLVEERHGMDAMLDAIEAIYRRRLGGVRES